MNKNSLFLTVFLLFYVATNYGQNTFDIIFPNTNGGQNCQQFELLYRQKPKEVGFSIVQEKSSLYFEMNDRKFFNQLFKHSGDGIAIDAVPKSRYDCAEIEVANIQIKGILLKPVYTQQLKKNIKIIGKNKFRILVGKLPETLLNEDFEFNILFLQNKNLCRYQRLYDIASYPWDLLDMGMYLDSLSYNAKKVKPIDQENYVVKYKSLKFEIPFEKNKSEYLEEDIKPLYDS